MTCKQLAEALGLQFVPVDRAIKSMLKYKEIDFYELTREEAAEVLDYKINRRVCIYFPLNFKFVPPALPEVEHNLES
jgi:hypothetical protein